MRWNHISSLNADLFSKKSLNNTFIFSIHEDLNEIKIPWKKSDDHKFVNLWLSFDFQQDISSVLPDKFKVIYGVFSYDNVLIEYFPIYLIDFSLNKSIKFKNPFKYVLAKLVKAKILLMGQFLSTGQNFPFIEFLTEREFQIALHSFLQKVAVKYEAKAILWKDFFSNSPALEENGYFSFNYQPTMIMTLRGEWQNMKDYENALVSKYRIRLNRARKKGKGIVWLNLSVTEIIKWQSEIYNLYNGIISDAVFNIAIIPETYFSTMKSNFHDKYNLTAGFLDGKLVCFYSTILNGSTLEANLVGFDKNLNLRMQIYLNMLFLMVEEGIKLKVENINFYRTAMEIKSSLGAKAYPSFIYIKPTSTWFVPFFHLLIPWFSPKNPSWLSRSPFKTPNL